MRIASCDRDRLGARLGVVLDAEAQRVDAIRAGRYRRIDQRAKAILTAVSKSRYLSKFLGSFKFLQFEKMKRICTLPEEFQSEAKELELFFQIFFHKHIMDIVQDVMHPETVNVLEKLKVVNQFQFLYIL